MTRLEFEELQGKFNESGMTLKSFLSSQGIPYSTYNYWKRKRKEIEEDLPMAPITIFQGKSLSSIEPMQCGMDLPGVTLAFPNGLRAHFGNGSEKVLMDVLTKSMYHVLP